MYIESLKDSTGLKMSNNLKTLANNLRNGCHSKCVMTVARQRNLKSVVTFINQPDFSNWSSNHNATTTHTAVCTICYVNHVIHRLLYLFVGSYGMKLIGFLLVSVNRFVKQSSPSVVNVLIMCSASVISPVVIWPRSNKSKAEFYIPKTPHLHSRCHLFFIYTCSALLIILLLDIKYLVCFV